MQEQPTYYQLFPAELHQQVDKVIDYLTYFPFEKPKQCLRCGSKSIFPRRPTQQQVITYQCLTCKKEFNRLTGTLFSRSRFISLWGRFAEARFSGKTTEELIKAFGISQQAVSYRDSVLMRYLKQEYPDVYDWWKPYHDRVERQIKNSAVELEVTVLREWLQTILSTESVVCPQCTDRKMRRSYSHRLSFVCDKCETFISLLKGTPFHKLGHMDKWLPFLELLTQGDSDSDISRKLNISLIAAKNWRTAFFMIIQEKELTNLNKWIIWQRKRRVSQAINDGYKNSKQG